MCLTLLLAVSLLLRQVSRCYTHRCPPQLGPRGGLWEGFSNCKEGGYFGGFGRELSILVSLNCKVTHHKKLSLVWQSSLGNFCTSAGCVQLPSKSRILGWKGICQKSRGWDDDIGGI